MTHLQRRLDLAQGAEDRGRANVAQAGVGEVEHAQLGRGCQQVQQLGQGLVGDGVVVQVQRQEGVAPACQRGKQRGAAVGADAGGNHGELLQGGGAAQQRGDVPRSLVPAHVVVQAQRAQRGGGRQQLVQRRAAVHGAAHVAKGKALQGGLT